MIFDRREYAEKYAALHEKFAEAFAFIGRAEKENLPVGRYELDGERLFAMVQEYDTKAPGLFEAHRKYIDIQFIVSGKELIGYTNISKLEPDCEYDGEKDFILYKRAECSTELILENGDFAVFFPEDGHMPGVMVNESSPVVKIVVKVKA